MFGLEIRESTSPTEDRLFLCPHLTWSEIAGLINEQNILLSIRFFPTNFEDYMRKDRSTLHYLHDQAGLGIPIRLLLGPRSQVRVNIGNTKEKVGEMVFLQVRMLCYFASIHQIIFSEISRKEGRRYQVKLILSNDPDAEQPIIFTFDSKLTADTVLHTLEGYCKLSPDIRTNSAATGHSTLLLNGCPFRPLMDPSAYDQIGKCLQNHQCLLRSHITLERVLGEGQFGDVYKGTYRPPEAGFSTISVAVKACKVGLGSEEKQRWLGEANLHAKLAHPHIVKLYGACRDEPVWLVLEFAGEGEVSY
ncbi:Inactive tyrosine-protein kinase kin-32 [Taenia solium]|eukprot:TsM_001126400 transcript=TsM_001126400 gene=TsM_001126400